jgi:hypothetical protein
MSGLVVSEREEIFAGNFGQSPLILLIKLRHTPTNIQFDPLSWMCPIAGAFSLLSDEAGNNVDLPW